MFNNLHGHWSVTQKKYSVSLTDWAFLVSKKDTTVAAVCIGHADVVPICPVEFPEGCRQYA